MNKKYLVAFEVETKQMSLEELSSRIGIIHSDGSYSIGDTRAKSITESTLWKLVSSSDEEASIEDQCEKIFSVLRTSRIHEPNVLPSDCKYILDIAVFYYTLTCSISIPAKVAKLIEPFNTEIHVSCYPCSEE